MSGPAFKSNRDTPPVCTVIAGPNGAGKTTFALKYLRGAGQCDKLVNADLIAAGLSPLDPERESVAAGRLFLQEIRRFIRARDSFAFATALSGRDYLPMIRRMVDDGWCVELVNLWLPNVAFCQERVAEALEMKRRLGHYAVIAANRQPRRVPADQIESLITLAREPR